MDPLQQAINRKLAGLNGLSTNFQAAVGDAFNLQNLAQILVNVENQNDMTPQMTEATEYANYIPVVTGFTAAIDTSNKLKRKKGVGEGQAHSGTGSDIPLAEVVYDDIDLPTKAGSIGYEYGILELAAASLRGIALDADKIEAARLGYEKHMGRVAFYGEASTGVKGLLNQTGVDVIAVAEAWETATADEILADVNSQIESAMDASEFNTSITPDTFLIPTSLMSILVTRRLADNLATTILDHVLKNNMLTLQGKPFIIRAMSRLQTAGVGGTRRTIMYRRDPACIEMRIPQEVQFLTGQPRGLDVFFPGHYLYQGVWLKRVDSLRYMDVPQKP